MSVKAGVDYVFSPKTTRMGKSGVVTGFVVGFQDCIAVVPVSAIGGGGRTVTTTSYSLGDAPPLQSVQAMLADSAVTLDVARETVRDVAAGSEDGLLVELAGLKALRVKSGWFSRGVYYKQPEHRGWRALPLGGGRAVSDEFARFYRAQLRE